MALGALAMGFRYADLWEMPLNDYLIFSAITAEANSAASSAGSNKRYREATQADIESLKRM